VPFWVSADDDAKGSNSGTKRLGIPRRRLWSASRLMEQELDLLLFAAVSVSISFNGSPVSDGEQGKYY